MKFNIEYGLSLMTFGGFNYLHDLAIYLCYFLTLGYIQVSLNNHG